jgi:unsaturated rhamnogalacturonyl hydrolase
MAKGRLAGALIAVAMSAAVGQADCGQGASSGNGAGASGGASSGSSSGNSGSGASTSSGGGHEAGAGSSSSGSGGSSGSGSTSSGGVQGDGGSSGGTPYCVPKGAQAGALAGVDVAKLVIDAAVTRTPSATSLKWTYPNGIFLHGMYLASKRLGDTSYLDYVKAWADANKSHTESYDSLDNMQPSLVLDDMYRETMDASYKTVPAAIRTRLDTYPRTSDGAFWHMTTLTGQNWTDGTFMLLSPLVNYGELFNDSAYTAMESAKQLTLYDAHLQAPNKLHYHAYDEPGTAGWSGETMKHSCCEWCRGEAWYEMAIVMSLDKLPASDTNRAALMTIVNGLAQGLAATQDPSTGRWWEVMDMPTDPRNWLETSCSAMHTFFLSRAIQQGYLQQTGGTDWAGIIAKGFQGVLDEVSASGDVANIVAGSVVGDAAYYFAQQRITNDPHGMGVFLIMYDQLTCP